MAASTAVVNSAAGWTAGIQWTVSAGGASVEWYTPALQAVTLSGVLSAHIRAAESNALAQGTVRLQVAVVNGDGTGAATYGSACANAEMATSEGVVTLAVAGPDISITQGQRLRFRLLLDDFEAALVTAYTATVYYSGATPGASGDTYVTLPVALTEYVAASPIGIPFLPGFHRPQFTRPRRRIMS